jgi:hypothetical protein
VKRADEGAAETLRKPVSSGPVSLSNGYQRAIAQIESLAENRQGSDKTWVESSLLEYRAHYSRAIRVR